LRRWRAALPEEGEQGAAIAAAVMPAIGALDAERARFYGDLVLKSVNEATKKALEAKMKGYEFQSDFVKKCVALGRDEGRALGRDEGRNEGRAEEAARAVLTAFRVRRIAVSAAEQERILASKDPAQLERWLERAIVAASVAEVLDEPGQAS
jgi:hypothetical protein